MRGLLVCFAVICLQVEVADDCVAEAMVSLPPGLGQVVPGIAQHSVQDVPAPSGGRPLRERQATWRQGRGKHTPALLPEFGRTIDVTVSHPAEWQAIMMRGYELPDEITLEGTVVPKVEFCRSLLSGIRDLQRRWIRRRGCA